VGPVPVGGNPVVRGIFSHGVVMEIILAWLWVVGGVAFLVLLGYLLQGRRESYCLKDRLLPNHLELFRQRQRRRQQYPTLKRLSRLN
jgi:hypothetical protein